MSSLSLPEGVTLEQVMAALKSQSNAQAIQNEKQPKLNHQQLTDLLAIPFEPSTHINSNNRNGQHISCVFCRTIILAPNAAQYDSKLIQLPALIAPLDQINNPSSPLLNDHQHVWRVEDQMSFENVGVSRPADPTIKYLLCGECDRGPIGLTYLNQPNIFYVAHGTVVYT